MPPSMLCLSLATNITVQANKLRPPYSSEIFFKLSQLAMTPYVSSSLIRKVLALTQIY